MKKQVPSVDTKCVVCGKQVNVGEKYEFAKQKRGKIIYFHTECYENLKKKG